MTSVYNRLMNIYPSILTDSVETLQQQLDLLAPFKELIAGVQVDIIDGEFTDNLTVSPIDLIAVDWHDFFVAFHLMVNEPDEYLYECRQIDNLRGVIAQIERMNSQQEFIEELHKHDLKAGLSLNRFTPVNAIDRESWEKLDMIQVMGNEAGIQGQEFAGEPVLKKIREIDQLRRDESLDNLELIVDIGVNEKTVAQLVKAGADAGAPGSALWKSTDLAKTLHELSQA